MIDHLYEQPDTKGFGVGHIYFEYQEQKQQTSPAVIASLVKQLVSQMLPANIPEEIVKKYQKKKPQPPSLNDLTDMLLSMRRHFKAVFVVCDALDEMDQHEQRDHLLPLFRRLKDSGIALFLTTRPHPVDIRESFRDDSIIELAPKSCDIRRYVEQRLSVDLRYQRLLKSHGDLHERTVSQIVDSAAGMYGKMLKFQKIELTVRIDSC